MNLFDRILGKPLATADEGLQRITPRAGVPVLGLDALSSSAYGPEAALTVLLPLGALGLNYILPLTLAIITLLFIVYLSYLQTIGAYPEGGGSYTVAKENLGTFPSLLAAAALMLDYILVVAVGISAGVGALISAVPALEPFTLSLCLAILALITLINLRGIKESGSAFSFPTYLFVIALFAILCIGLYKTVLFHGNPPPVQVQPHLAAATAPFTLWLIARAFASGCTAMTGVEAVSNGVKVFNAPVTKNARRSLSYIIFILIFLLAGIAYLATVYHIGATDPGQPGYESIISQLVSAVIGRGFFYYVTLASVIAVLALSANTGFADFPRLCQIVSNDNYMPHIFSVRGRRLVFTSGILVLAFFSGLLLILFGGVTDRLIPLFAIGAFLAFTLSQAGMVVHWKKLEHRHSNLAIVINFIGAVATGLTLLVVLTSKFAEGGWITFALVPSLIVFFYGVRRHYVGVAREISCHTPLEYSDRRPPIVVIPVRGWNRITRKALQFSMNMSPDVFAVYVENEDTPPGIIEDLWKKYITPNAGSHQQPQLVRLSCPYRKLFLSLLDYVDMLGTENPGRQIAVLIPDLVEHRWYHYFLHNQRAAILKAALRLRANPNVIVVDIPWYLKS